jgi:6,7-dimethyl-8-ribityllumazine synthase
MEASMSKIIEGQLNAAGLKVAVVASRFNGFIVDHLVAGAVDAVARTGGDSSNVTVFRCPGAFETPQLLRRVVARGGFDAVVCVGAVIRGATPHFDYVAGEVARGVSAVAASAGMPVTFGVITTDTIEQAIERAGTKAGNKGWDAAMAAIEMVNLFRRIDED